MRITVTEGLDIVSVGVSSIAACFRVRRPVSVVWPDCQGSVGEYLCMLPYPDEEKKFLQDRIMTDLYTDFTGNEAALYESLKPLFSLFPNGEYSLYFNNGTKAPVWTVSSGGGGNVRQYEPSWYVQYSPAIDKSQITETINLYHQHLRERGFTESESSLVEFTTGGFYEWEHELFIATRAEHTLDEERVHFFEEEIKSGKRPFAILLQCQWRIHDIDTHGFVLDGHHKLRAYQNLNMRPPLAVITRMLDGEKSGDLDILALAECMYPWQVKHIIDHSDERNEYVAALLQKDNSLGGLIRRGEVKEYHANGKLKHEGLYINDNPEGTIREWHDNGKLKSERHYRNNVRVGTWKECFRSGRTYFTYSYDDKGQYHGLMRTYFENGHIRSECEYEHGKYADGYSFSRWLGTGYLERETWYKNNILIARKSYDDGGMLIRHDQYSPETGKLEPVEVPIPYRPPVNSSYKQRQDMIRFVWIVALIFMAFLFIRLLKEM